AGHRAAHAMTKRAWAREEDLLTCDRDWVSGFHRRLQLCCTPGLVGIWFLDDRKQAHARVLGAAEFCALSGVFSGLRTLDANVVWLPGNQVDLAVERGNPEGVHHVIGLYLDVHGAARGQMKLIGCRECEARMSVQVLDLPPPLMTDNADFRLHAFGHLHLVHAAVHAMDGKRTQQAESEQEQDRQYNQRNHNPPGSDPHLAAARADRLVVSEAAAPAIECPGKQRPHDDADDEKQNRHSPRQSSNAVSRWPMRVQRGLYRA